MTTAHDIRTPASAAAGARLSQARQAQNLATADVARRLKLSVWQVEALEGDRHHELPGPIFVRGFIRNYARLLKLDADELVRSVAGSLPSSALRPETPRSRDIPFPDASNRRWLLPGAGVAVVVVLLSVYTFFFDDVPRSIAKRPAAEAPASKAPQATKTPSPASTPLAETVRAGQSVATPVPSAPIARHAPAAASVAAPRQQ